MEVFIKKRNGIYAKGIYNIETRSLVVLKGSTVSETVSHSGKFRSANSVEKYREQFVKGTKVVADIEFKSASTAANFVTGISTNGLVAWKNEEGKTIKEIMTDQ